MNQNYTHRIEWWDGENWNPEESFDGILDAIGRYEEVVRQYPDVYRRLIKVFKED